MEMHFVLNYREKISQVAAQKISYIDGWATYKMVCQIVQTTKRQKKELKLKLK